MARSSMQPVRTRSLASLAAMLVLPGALLVDAAVPQPAAAAETRLFVAQGGSDAGTCAAQSSPCATVSYALTQAATWATIKVSGRIHDHVNITFPVNISGADAPAGSPAVLDGSNSGTVVTIGFSGGVTLDRLRIENGNGERGGGINSSRATTLTNTTVTGNTARMGGGIYSSEDMTLINSTVSGNTADRVTDGDGGGVLSADGELKLIDSTVSGNSAQRDGGGIRQHSFSLGSIELNRSTVSGNTATVAGGGVSGLKITTIDSTVAENSAQFGGGVQTAGSPILLRSTVARNTASTPSRGAGVDSNGPIRMIATIVASNQTGMNCFTNRPEVQGSLGYNLTNDATGTACGLGDPTDVVNANPVLGLLADNGGATKTMVPAGSSAIGVIPRGAVPGGVPACQGADQRGIARPQPGSSSCAVGAVEPGTVLAAAPAITSAAAATVLAGAPINVPVTTTGAPVAALTASSLPLGVSLTDNGDGSGALTGSTGLLGEHQITLQAANGISPDATQSFTLMVDAPALSVGDVTVTEGSSGTTAATFTVNRTGNTSGTSSVTAITASHTADAGRDYTALTGTPVTFAPGVTSMPVTVAVIGDTALEVNEVFMLHLSSPVGATLPDSQGFGTIVDDDAPTYLAVSDALVTEGNSGTTDVTFTVTRSGALTAPSSVRVATFNGTATSGSDYTALPSTLVSFAASDTAKTVTVTVTGDTAAEANETFTLALSSATGAVISDAAGVATIVDDEPAAFLSVDNISVTEGNAATTAATFRVTRSGNITGASSVRVVTANGNATGGVDYTALPTTTVDFAAGVTSKPVTVSVTGDTAVEPNETFSLNLSSAVGGVISDSSGLATIVNDEPATYLAVSDVTITEGTGQTASAAFTLTRTGNLALTTTVKVATADGTAIKNSDYTALQPTTISLAPQETTKTIGVSVTGDTADEANESFTLTLTSPTGAVLSDAVGVATIVDNEGPVVPGPSSYISVGDFSLAEGNSGTKTGTFTLTRSGNLNQSSTVTFATVNGTATAGADYTARVATPLTFSPQQSTKSVSVTVLGDATLEANESFSLSLTSSINAVISDGIGAGTIANDDATYVSVADVMVAEGTAGPKAFVFNLTRTGSLGGSSSVNVATGNGSALAGTDYTALLATPVSFAAGEVTKTVTVNATGDTAPEANETFSLVLSSPAGATLIDGTGTGTVLNDDGASYLSVGDIAAPELGPTTFTVTRSGNTTAPATVTVATSNGSALAGTDYTALAATTVTFAAGQTSKQITVTITGDSIDEPNETFWLGLSAPVGAVISDSSGLATIIDDERTP